jgi:hypothetical protein
MIVMVSPEKKPEAVPYRGGSTVVIRVPLDVSERLEPFVHNQVVFSLTPPVLGGVDWLIVDRKYYDDNGVVVDLWLRAVGKTSRKRAVCEPLNVALLVGFASVS